MSKRILGFGFAISVAVVTVTAASALGGGGDRRPRKVHAAHHGARVKADLGSYCVRRGNAEECADAVFAGVPHPRLPVEAHDRVLLRTGDHQIADVHVATLHIHGYDFTFTGWDTRAHRVRGTSARWRFRLPGDLGDANAVDMDVRYRHHIGDAEYTFGIKRR